MSEYEEAMEPEWDTPLTVTVTPGAIIDTVFATADAVHTGYESCIEAKLVVVDITAHDEASENYCRYVEQEYVEDDDPEITWHDWTVELSIEGTFVAAHWRVQVTGSPSDWDWCASEAEKAFTNASVLVGKRVRRGIVVDDASYGPRPPRTHH